MIIVCDIDGTTSDDTHRRHLLPAKDASKEKRDYEPYFRLMGDDIPILGAQRVLPKLTAKEGNWLVYLTGRPERFRTVTESWLARHIDAPQPAQGVRSLCFMSGYSSLLMRADNDYRSALDYKHEVVKFIASVAGHPLMFFEDDERNADMMSVYGTFVKAPECWDVMR